MTRALGTLQVASLLVSASYGIGFLFGSGELAITHGMAGSIYGIATGLGMLLLAGLARYLWVKNLPVWDLFGRTYGPGMQATVALLSLVWMAGVLAAQIQGGVTVLRLLGLGSLPGYFVILTLIYGGSRLDLRFASSAFALCLLASAVVLVYALVVADGIELYLRAIPTFAQDLATFRPSRLFAISLAVCLLVCTGADYHQFVLAAGRPSAAVLGCVLAGLALFIIAFLPSAVVVSMQHTNSLADVTDGKQVMPWVLARVAGSIGPGADKVMLVALSAAALGSGAAILRAMTSALASAVPGQRSSTHPALAMVGLSLGAALASRSQGIVDTMVSVNVIYIASIGVCFVALLRQTKMSSVHAVIIVGVGFSAALAAYLAIWAGWIVDDADFVALTCGLVVSICTAMCTTAIPGGWLRNKSGPRR